MFFRFFFSISNVSLITYLSQCSGLLFYEQVAPISQDDQTAKLQLCSRYLQTFTQVKEMENDFTEVSIELLTSMREMLQMDQVVYFYMPHFVLFVLLKSLYNTFFVLCNTAMFCPYHACLSFLLP